MSDGIDFNYGPVGRLGTRTAPVNYYASIREREAQEQAQKLADTMNSLLILAYKAGRNAR